MQNTISIDVNDIEFDKGDGSVAIPKLIEQLFSRYQTDLKFRLAAQFKMAEDHGPTKRAFQRSGTNPCCNWDTSCAAA